MRRFLIAVLLIACMLGQAEASNSADAFMSLNLGLSYARVQKRMENSGAKTTVPRKESLTMEGMFEGYPAMFVFGFFKEKILTSKAVYLQSLGDTESDSRFYTNIQKAHNLQYGSGRETPVANTRKAGKIMLRNVWTPDRYTTITLTYNPEMSKRLPGTSISSRFIQLIYKSSKWE